MKFVTVPALAQHGFGRRFDWGVQGALNLAANVDALIVVDVLSFSTAVDVAVAAGASVIPVPWRDERAAKIATERTAQLAVGRRDVSADRPYSLSPQTLRHLPPGSRLVLPSPNGATICAEVASSARGLPLFAGCLRNASAVATNAAECGPTIGVVAAGERWADGSLRPAVEDLIGAGAILAALGGTWSPEAHVAVVAAGDGWQRHVRDCASARELVAYGYAEDVTVAFERDGSDVVPRARDGAFEAA